MNNYNFECANGKYGFFKVDSNADKYHILINDGFLDSFNSFSGKLSRFSTYEHKSSDSLDWIVATDPIVRLLSIILWHDSAQNRNVVKIFENNSPGCFYKRSIRRKIYTPNDNSVPIYDYDSKLDEIRSFNSIYTSMLNLFDFIEPETANLGTYSNKIRENLILGCTEVEYLWKKTLEDNNYPNNGRLSTKDYIKTLNFLKLKDYSVKLKMFPSLGLFSPFSTWNYEQPTKSLEWYDSYNEVKHDRGNNKSKATLKMLINSVAAIHILLESHYGCHVFDSPMRSQFESAFQTETGPQWDISEIPMPHLGTNQAWTQAISVRL